MHANKHLEKRCLYAFFQKKLRGFSAYQGHFSLCFFLSRPFIFSLACSCSSCRMFVTSCFLDLRLSVCLSTNEQPALFFEERVLSTLRRTGELGGARQTVFLSLSMHACMRRVFLGCMYTLQYLSQRDAQNLDADLMGPEVGYSVDQVKPPFSLSVHMKTNSSLFLCSVASFYLQYSSLCLCHCISILLYISIYIYIEIYRDIDVRR